MFARLLISHVAALAVLSGAGRATAQERLDPQIAIRLEYDPGPPQLACPSRREFAAHINSLFEYVVVRDDAQARLVVTVGKKAGAFDAEMKLFAADDEKDPRWNPRKRNTYHCQELIYDLAVDIREHLGPLGWGEDATEPPPWLRAPAQPGRPDSEPEKPQIGKDEVSTPPEPAVAALPPSVLAVVDPGAFPPPNAQPQASGPKAEVGLGAVMSPYGLPSVGVGGSGLIGLRWPNFFLAADFRGVVTPSATIGAQSIPGRTSLWTGALLPCVATKHVDICGIIAASQLNFNIPSNITVGSTDGFSLGFGTRVAARWTFGSIFALTGYGELTAQLRTLSLAGESSDGKGGAAIYWRTPTARITLGLAIHATIPQ
jgi:hypothetical protein